MGDYTQKIRLWSAGVDEIRFLQSDESLPDFLEVDVPKSNAHVAWTNPPTRVYTERIIFRRQIAGFLLAGDYPMYIAEEQQ